MLCLTIITSCSDPTPLRSNTEVIINDLFNTNFGVVNQITVKEFPSMDTVTVLNPTEFVNNLDNIKEQSIKKKDNNYNFLLIFQTEEDQKEYSKSQKKETVYYNTDNKILCSKDICYKVPSSLVNFFSVNGIE